MMPQAFVILAATFAFAGVAFIAGWPLPPQQCRPVEVIRHLHTSEPTPIYPAPALLKVTDIQPQNVIEEADENGDQPDRRRHRHRRWRRR